MDDKNKVKFFSDKMYFMSFICTILVVYIHVFNLETYNIEIGFVYHIENFVTNYIARMAVPFFFISSAFWTFSNEKSTFEYYKNKMTTLFIPYICWNVIFMISFYLLTILSLSDVGVISNFEDLISGILFYKFNSVYWFMYQLILFSLLYPAFKCILKYKKFAFSIFCFICAIYLIFREIEYSNIPFIHFESLVYYFFGALLGCYYKSKIIFLKNKEKKKIIVLSIVSLLILAIIEILDFKILTNLILIRNIFLIIFIFILLDYLYPRKNKRYYKFSFMFYSMHSLVLEMIEKLIYIFLPRNNFFALFDYIFAPIFTLLLICFICLLFCNTKIFKILSGKRC